MRQFFYAASVCLACFAGDAGMAARDTDAECREIDRKIERIQARMRSGYSAKEGVRLKERLRELRRKRYDLCR